MPTRILIADDSPTVRASLSELFRKEGYATTVAGDADAVIAACERNECDLFLLNTGLTGAGSFEFYERIKRISPSTPVVVISRDTHFRACLEAINRGADDVLVHPPDPTHLLAVVNRVAHQVERRRNATNSYGAGEWLVPLNLQILEYSPVGVAVVDADGALAYANRELAALFSIDQRECVGTSFLDLVRRVAEEVDPAFAEVLATIREVRDGRELAVARFRIDGADRYLDIHLTRIDGAGDTLGGVMILFHDISRWIVGYQLLDSVVKDSADAIVVTDNDLGIRLWSRGAREIYGYTTEEVVGRSLSILYPRDESSNDAAKLLATFDSSPPTQKTRAQRCRKDGNTVDVELTRYVLRDDRGRPLGVCEVVRDIGRDLAREREIEALKNFYERIIDTISDGIRVIEASTRNIVLTNQAHLEWIGMVAGDVIGRSTREVRWGVDESAENEKIEALVHRAIESGRPEREVLAARPLHRSQIRWKDVMAYPMTNPRGAIEYVVLVGRDITERVEMEARLAAERDEREQVFDSAPIGILTADTRGIIEFANPQIAQIFGLIDADAIIWRNLFELPQVRQMGLSDEIRRVLTGGHPLRRDHIITTTAQGRETVVNVRAEPLFDEDQRVTGLVAVVENVTEKVSLQRRLSATTADLMMLAQIGELFQESRSPETILQAILVGVTAGEGLGFNRAFLLTTDWERKMLAGKYAIGPADREEASRIWSELKTTPHTLPDILIGYRRAIERGEVRINDLARQLELSLEDAENIAARAAIEQRALLVTNGRQHPMIPPELPERLGTDMFAVVPLILSGRVEGVIIADNAITDKAISDDDLRSLELFAHQAMLAVERSQLYTELESRLREVEEAHHQLKENQEIMLRNERLTAMGQVAAQVAHEIRNPLVAIGGFARTVLRQLPEDDQKREYLQIVVDEVVRLEKILGEVLEFSRPRPLRRERMDLVALIRRAFGIVQEELSDRGIEARTDLPSRPIYVDVDADQIRQVLQNLLKNAIDAITHARADMKAGEETGAIWVGLELGKDHAVVEIRDSGPGLNETMIARIFEPFFTTKHEGTGLGLAICQQIIHAHGGEISVANHPDGGAVFFVSLPLGDDNEEVSDGAHTRDRR